MSTKNRPAAIIYTSNTGHTAEYARLLGEQIGLPVYTLKTARSAVASGKPVIYLGWLMAGKVKGYADAAKRYDICALCGVGMARSGSQLEDIRKANNVPAELPVFSLQGGFEMEKLHGIYRLMMGMMRKGFAGQLQKKPNRTEEENESLDLLLHGRSMVRVEELSALLDWYRAG